MSHFLFLDESGRDHGESPYEVLAGVTVEDRDLWNLVRAIQDSEIKHFGTRYSVGAGELKGKKLLEAESVSPRGPTRPARPRRASAVGDDVFGARRVRRVPGTDGPRSGETRLRRRGPRHLLTLPL